MCCSIKIFLQWNVRAQTCFSVTMYNVSSMDTRLAKAEVEELDLHAQNRDLIPSEHLSDELEWQFHSRPPHPTSRPDLTNALVAEWAIPHSHNPNT